MSTPVVPRAQNKPGYFDALSAPAGQREGWIGTRTVTIPGRRKRASRIRGQKGISQSANASARQALHSIVQDLRARAEDSSHDGRDYIVAYAAQQPESGVRVTFAFADKFANSSELASLKPGDKVPVDGELVELIAYVPASDDPDSVVFPTSFHRESPLWLIPDLATLGVSYWTRAAVRTEQHDEAQQRQRDIVTAPFAASPFLEGLATPPSTALPSRKS